MGRLAIGLGLAAVAAAMFVWVAVAGSAPSVPTSEALWFKPTHQQPVVGRVFTALVILENPDAQFTPPGWQASCGNAVIGHRHLALQQRSLFGGSPWDTMICSWRIPTGAGGKQLRVFGAETSTTAGTAAQVPALSWRVTRG
jgi:hypothetical protein